MKKPVPALLEDPPLEDSEDLTQEETRRAVFTTSSDDLVEQITQYVKEVSGFSVRSHELRRRDDHMFCRIRLGAASEPDKVLIYQVDWVIP